MRGPRVLSYVLAVDVLALASFGLVWSQHAGGHWAGVFLLGTLVALAGATPVRIPGLKTTVSVTDPFVFTALAAYGGMPACLVAAAGVFGATLGSERAKPLHLSFNLGNVVLSTAVGSQVYAWIGGDPAAGLQAQIWPLVAAATVYFLLNTGLVSAAIAVETRRGFAATWRQSGLWTAVPTYAGLTLSVGLLAALEGFGPSGLALGIPPCWLLSAFYRSHKERQERQQERIRQVEVLNLQLEDMVADRTRELQRAVSHIERTNFQLVNANARLTDANRSKSEFLASVSHELRTPLNAIIGFSDLLSDESFGKLSDQQEDFLRDINESGEHLLRLINDILDLTKIEAGKMEISRTTIDVPDSIREATAMLHPQAKKKRLSVHVDCARDVQVAELDSGMFRQILVNLLSNAVKFTPEGGSVGITARREGQDLRVHVEDTGIGIRKDDAEKIFCEFYQVDGSYSRNYEGTGLGLALVRSMVELHGGEISVRSIVNEGSCFTCRFPECLLDHAGDDPIPPRVVRGGPAATILVVDADPIQRKIVRNLLHSRGYDVVECENADRALESVRDGEADLVLIDAGLCGVSDPQLAHRLRRSSGLTQLPIVAMTSATDGVDQADLAQAGFVGRIEKPIRLAELPARVAAYIAAGTAAQDETVGSVSRGGRAHDEAGHTAEGQEAIEGP